MNRLENAAVFALTVLGIEPHQGQVAYLVDRSQTKVLVGGRRSGKSTAVAIEVLFHAALAIHARRPHKQLLIAPSTDQASLLFSTVARLLQESPLGGLIESEVRSPFRELRLPHDVRIFVRSAHEQGKHLRGHSAHRVVVDEAAYLPDAVIQESVRPILADVGGDLVLASTPTTKGTLFHRLYGQGQDGGSPHVRSFRIRSEENTHIDQSYVAEQRQSVTAKQFAVEYGGLFHDETDAVFRWEHIAAAAIGEEAGPASGRRYVIGWDPARTRDRSALAVADMTSRPIRIVHVSDLRGADYIEQVKQAATIGERYRSQADRLLLPRFVVDATAHGAVIVDLLRAQGMEVQAVTFSERSKSDLVTGLAVLLERGELLLPPRRDLLDEFRYYEQRTMPSGKVRYSAPSGGYDDFVTAIALAVAGSVAGSTSASAIDPRLPPFLTGSTPFCSSWASRAGMDAGGDGPWFAFGEL